MVFDAKSGPFGFFGRKIDGDLDERELETAFLSRLGILILQYIVETAIVL